jgi:hypothetical protein
MATGYYPGAFLEEKTIMQEQTRNVIRLAFVSADTNNPDPAIVGEVARQTVTDLRGQGYTVRPARTGAKGGDVFTIAAQLGQNIVDNKELLIALLGLATPILTFLLDRIEQRLDREEQSTALSPHTQEQSTNTYIIINQATAQVEADDLDDNDRLLRKLLAVQPDLIDTVTPESTLQIEVQVAQ